MFLVINIITFVHITIRKNNSTSTLKAFILVLPSQKIIIMAAETKQFFRDKVYGVVTASFWPSK